MLSLYLLIEETNVKKFRGNNIVIVCSIFIFLKKLTEVFMGEIIGCLEFALK